MLLFLIFAVSLLALTWRRLHKQNLEDKFELRLFALRDELRRMAIEGKIDSDSPVFLHYDYSFSKMINERYYISLVYLGLLTHRYKDNEEIKEYKKYIEQNADYAVVKDIRSKFDEILNEYLIGQHFVSIQLIKPFLALFSLATYFQKRFHEIRRITLYFPQTSGIAELSR
ncbi:MAG: hypothetical protein JNK77_01065 [Saprospiraceae bacterium]|nr:hypothetical protein [Saprospiraceae bacterium]